MWRSCDPPCREGTEHALNHDGKAKTPGDIWGGYKEGGKDKWGDEATVVIRGNELLQGVPEGSGGDLQFGPAFVSRSAV